ncbi:hypothetical protein BpHYR1_006031 [Brachionus plicatilis]|uniref:Uncharacterized protein n=1 Tax=Brachionus plicatilis TaxID=10195 RepID=A0A3M7PX66_BRAPC|nr:hypothetical protein BpHYR1_006031 [Brachionus plicatilis]
MRCVIEQISQKNIFKKVRTYTLKKKKLIIFKVYFKISKITILKKLMFQLFCKLERENSAVVKIDRILIETKNLLCFKFFCSELHRRKNQNTE